MANLLRTADSRDDLTAIWLFIAQDNVLAADGFVDEIDRTLRLLASFPFLGEAVGHLRPETRRFTVGNYSVVLRADCRWNSLAARVSCISTHRGIVRLKVPG